MAAIYITFYKDEPNKHIWECQKLETISLIGAKQSKKVTEQSGYSDLYYIRKKNKYGIKWVVVGESRYGSQYKDISVDGTGENVPSNKYFISIR